MLIGGLQKMSLIDYPGKMAATVFTLGCNFKCPFCHNSELAGSDQSFEQAIISEEDFFRFLEERQGFLEGVCLTGGEPLMQKDIVNFVRKIKAGGFLVKLDTNGSYPEKLQDLLDRDLLDYVAMDLKNVTNSARYSQAAGVPVETKNIFKSVDLIKKGSPDYEFRTTVVPGLVNFKEIKAIGQLLAGSKKFAIQQFRTQKTLNPKWQEVVPYSDTQINKMKQILKPYFNKVEIRGL